MCGIAGVMWFHSGEADRAVRAAERMQAALGHRGPDGSGMWNSALDAPVGIALAHTRLAVIDLGEAGAQPMRRNGLVVAYNGEIYNFREARARLADCGCTFSSESDTEVLLRAWETWDADGLSALRGMFAFGLWDERARSLTLARDRFGIKPLYVARQGGLIAFASEVRGLLESGLVSRRLNTSSLPHYLGFQTAAAPHTLVEGVEMLPPGSVTTIDERGRSESREYWSLLRSATGLSTDDHAGARARVRDLLGESTRDHLVSDVPIGVFLSGGVDSSALLSTLRTSGVTPRAFSVTFPERAYDESEYARLAARTFGADHTELRLTEEELLDSLPDFLRSVDHPSGDGANSFVISRLVRAQGIKVAWSGLGGDELFGGYPSFRRLSRAVPLLSQWARLPEPVRTAAAGLVRGGAPASVGADKIASALGSDGSVADLWPVTRQVFGAAERARLLREDSGHGDDATAYARLLSEAAEAFPQAPIGALISFAETRAYMHDVLLRDTDQMSMAHGLEVRVPLLDHRLAEYLMSLPDDVRLPAGRPKGLLIDSLERPLPGALVDRPKRGFTLPFETWMRRSLRGMVDRHLGQDGLEGRGVFRPGAVARVWRDFLDGRATVTWSRVWILVALDAWMDRLGIEVP
jgi:asparagine synthase (glutamine-hydrolysing)